MRAYPLLLGAYLLLCALPAQAADLSKIERIIAKEPKYQGKPQYCLLVFGPEAQFRVWVVLDENVLYVDRNGNGDLTEPNKRIERRGRLTGDIYMPDGKKAYSWFLRKVEDVVQMQIDLKDGRYLHIGFDGPGKLQFADRAQDAPIVHLLGPLTLQRFEPQPRSVSPNLKPEPLVRGQESTLAFSIGTPGLGSGTFAKYGLEGRDEERLTASAEIRFASGKTISIPLVADC